MSADIVCFVSTPLERARADVLWGCYRLMAASARRAMPASRLTVLLHGRLPPGIPADRVIPVSGDRRQLILVRTKAWRDFLAGPAFDRDTLFLDPDLLIQSDLREGFDGGFDLGLTWHPPGIGSHAVNGGVVLAAHAGKERAAALMARIVAIMESLPPDQWEWFGDQEAMVRLVGETAFASLPPPAAIDHPEGRIGLLPCDPWNYTPCYGSDETDAALARRRVLHFKGSRKQAMADYARHVLGLA